MTTVTLDYFFLIANGEIGFFLTCDLIFEFTSVICVFLLTLYLYYYTTSRHLYVQHEHRFDWSPERE